jgi:CBS domain-containing protein
MAKHVHEIMNHELFSVGPNEAVGRVRGYLVALGISGAPVLDDEQRPVGFVSLRDLVDVDDHAHVHVRMSAPVDGVPHHASISDAACIMADRGHHHLVVLDREGRAVGFVGALDALRGLLGKPVAHPDSFPHYDIETGLSWSDEAALEEGQLERAPDGPGLYVLVRGRAGESDRVVWSEATANVRTRLLGMISVPHTAPPFLVDEIQGGLLRFRAAAAPSTRALSQAVESIRARHRPAHVAVE